MRACESELNEKGIFKANSPAVLGIRGTPTLILVDATGNVRKVWIGKLPTEKESDVLDELLR